MKFFARIDNQQIGPLSLAQLVEAGIRPSTYVWTKGMPCWQKAEDVPDICRAMRRHLAGLDPETGAELAVIASSSPKSAYDNSVSANDSTQQPDINKSPRMFLRNMPEPTDSTDYSARPQGVSVIMAIAATVLCFPFTGLVAIYYAMKCNARWKMSLQEGLSPHERDVQQRMAHNDARIYRMMIGITFFIGLIMIGFALTRTGF